MPEPIMKVFHGDIAKAALPYARKVTSPLEGYTRDTLVQLGREIRRQVDHGSDPLLKALGFSLAGFRYVAQSRLGMNVDDAGLFAHALESVWQQTSSHLDR
jgi:hypothetical protein